MNVEVTSRGHVGKRAEQAARTKVAALDRYVDAPLMAGRVVLTQEENPRIERPARAEGEVLLAGNPVRARVASVSMDAAVDELAERLRVRMRDFVERSITRHRRPAEAPAGEWFHGARPTARPEGGVRPRGERVIMRRKVFHLQPETPADAAAEMEALDHDFYLYRDTESGADALMYRRDDGTLAVIDPPGVSLASAPLPVREQSRLEQAITLERAVSELDALDGRFLFFVNAESGRGNVLYLRLDGHYGLIEPAPER